MSIVFLLLFLLSCTTTVLSTKDDKTTLLKMKKQLGNPDILHNWVKGFEYCGIGFNKPPNSLYIACTDTDRVRKLTIKNIDFSASFPNAICGLTELESLEIYNWTGLHGPIPSCIRKLVNLRSLVITKTSLSGTLPSFSTNINLIGITLSNNHLSGTIPPSLSTLPNLQLLDLSSNYLCGEIPKGGNMGQFNPAGFANNTCLCGNPLPPCFNSAPTSAPAHAPASTTLFVSAPEPAPVSTTLFDSAPAHAPASTALFVSAPEPAPVSTTLFDSAPAHAPASTALFVSAPEPAPVSTTLFDSAPAHAPASTALFVSAPEPAPVSTTLFDSAPAHAPASTALFVSAPEPAPVSTTLFDSAPAHAPASTALFVSAPEPAPVSTTLFDSAPAHAPASTALFVSAPEPAPVSTTLFDLAPAHSPVSTSLFDAAPTPAPIPFDYENWVPPPVSQDEESLLLKMKMELGFPKILREWVRGYQFCGSEIYNWDFSKASVYCTYTGRVNYIVLQNLDVSAPFPDAICGLTELEGLEIYHSPGLHGPIPSCINEFVNLKYLIITNTSLSGSIPSLSKNTYLETIILNINHLSGTIPLSFSTFPLWYLDLSSNNLCGEIPKGGNMSHFEAAKFAYNMCLCGSPLPPCINLAPTSAPTPAPQVLAPVPALAP